MVSPDSDPSDLEQGQTDGADVAGSEGEEQKPKLSLDVKIEKPGACQRHITVTIAREDIDRYLSEAFDQLMPRAEVRGFRAGRAPRKLVENHYRDHIRDQVKGTLLLDSLQQISEEYEFSAISEPDFRYQAVELPDEGPLTFEFDLEVRPEFDMPEWKGLDVQRPVHEVSDDEVELHLKELLGRYSRLTPTEEPARAGDYVVVDVRFTHEGEELSSQSEQTICVRPKVSFRDGVLEGFDQLMAGAKAGDKRTTSVMLSSEASREDLAGKQVTAEFDVLEVKRQELPAMSQSFLDQLGGFSSEAEVREVARHDLERRVRYQQQRDVRRQITAQLTAGANWELPPDLLRRQARRELERIVMELQSSGFNSEQIEAQVNHMRQNILANTAHALREHFILERIAEEEQVEASEEDFENEIRMIAHYRSESPRRVRARLEKRGQLDTLRNQIIESKVIQLVTEHAKFTDVPFELPHDDTAPVSHRICGGQDEVEIPEAEGGEAESLRQPVDHS